MDNTNKQPLEAPEPGRPEKSVTVWVAKEDRRVGPRTNTVASAPTFNSVGCILGHFQIIILVSSLMLGIIAALGLLFVILSESVPVLAILELICLLVQVCLGIYSALYRNRAALILFSALCALNSFAMLLKLSIDLMNGTEFYKGLFRLQTNIAPNREVSLVGGHLVGCRKAHCLEDELNCATVCCSSELDIGCKSSVHAEYESYSLVNRMATLGTSLRNEFISLALPGKRRYSRENLIAYILLWFVAVYSLILAILSGLMAACSSRSALESQTSVRAVSSDEKHISLNVAPADTTQAH